MSVLSLWFYDKERKKFQRICRLIPKFVLEPTLCIFLSWISGWSGLQVGKEWDITMTPTLKNRKMMSWKLIIKHSVRNGVEPRLKHSISLKQIKTQHDYFSLEALLRLFLSTLTMRKTWWWENLRRDSHWWCGPVGWYTILVARRKSAASTVSKVGIVKQTNKQTRISSCNLNYCCFSCSFVLFTVGWWGQWKT